MSLPRCTTVSMKFLALYLLSGSTAVNSTSRDGLATPNSPARRTTWLMASGSSMGTIMSQTKVPSATTGMATSPPVTPKRRMIRVVTKPCRTNASRFTARSRRAKKAVRAAVSG